MTEQEMIVGPAAFGIWSGGRYMHFGEDIGREGLTSLVQKAYEAGIRRFVTADVYGEGDADSLLGEALAAYPRESYFLFGAVGHDFYHGKRQGEKGFPRFTDPGLRSAGYSDYLRTATERQLERLKTKYLDVLFLHNPDWIGYSSEEVWRGMAALREDGLARQLGIAPGPANGFTLDIISAFEKFGELIDWAMLILNPLEPWPGMLALPAAEKHGVRVLARVVDHGGLFHDDLRPGAKLGRHDHRSFRAPGWIEAAQPKLDRMREIASENGMTLLQLASRWALQLPAVEAVVPTLIQEAAETAKPIDAQMQELARVGSTKPLPVETVEAITKLGDNKGCMPLKGASTQYLGVPQADQWPASAELLELGKRWGIVADRDLYCPSDPRDLREFGMAVRGMPQAINRRLYLQLHAFAACTHIGPAIRALEESGLQGVLYEDMNAPCGIAVLAIADDPEQLVTEWRKLFQSEVFMEMRRRPELTMIGRTYSAGREPDLEDMLLQRPRRYALNPQWPWAIWYPLRRKPEFELLSREEQGKILMEHAIMGRNYGQAGYAFDIRLACYGLDQNDNEFVLGLMGPDLYPLSRLVQEMRKSQQTAKYVQSLGPFFVGRVRWQSALKG